MCLLGSLVDAFWGELWQEFLGGCSLFKLKQLSLGWRLIQWLLHAHYHTCRMPLITSTIIHHRSSTFSIFSLILAYVALNNILGRQHGLLVPSIAPRAVTWVLVVITRLLWG